MKQIDHMVDDSVQSQKMDCVTERDKKKIGKEITASVIALVCLIAGMLYRRLVPSQDTVYGLLFLLGFFVESIPILLTAAKGFLRKEMTSAMEILVSIAIFACVLDGQYELAILIPIILTLVHFLEEKSIMGGRDAIEGLKNMQADSAILLVNGEETRVDAKQLRPGDCIAVKPGMALPIDGVVIDGDSNLDQKSLTGESVPRAVTAGDTVYAGTTNIDGVLRVRVEKGYTDTSFQKIVTVLEEAEKISIPEVRIVDRFMRYYIPLALIIATLVWLFSGDVSRAIAILVVSCPCGQMLVSSAPMIAALAAATKRGVLIKNSAFIEKLADAEIVIFDKTGTITRGTLTVTDYRLCGASDYRELASAAATVAHASLHPVSRAIAALADTYGILPGYTVKEEIGKGMTGIRRDDAGTSEILLGNRRWLVSLGYAVPEEDSEVGSVSWVVKDGLLLGSLILSDTIREDAAEAVKCLKEMKIRETCLLTGDHEAAARHIQQVSGIDTMHCDLLPEQKLAYVREAKEHASVIVVGDGINDALALSEADIGIAMGAMGSDTAIQSADIALMNNSLQNIPFAIALSEKTRSIIYQNIVIAFLISAIMILLAASGLISALAGAIFHNAGAFIILINSGRLLKEKDTDTEEK